MLTEARLKSIYKQCRERGPAVVFIEHGLPRAAATHSTLGQYVLAGHQGTVVGVYNETLRLPQLRTALTNALQQPNTTQEG